MTTHPQHLIDMRRRLVGDGIPMALNNISAGEDIQAQINQLFPGLILGYDYGFGYVLRDAEGKARVLIGGKPHQWSYIRQWIEWQKPAEIVQLSLGLGVAA